MTCRNSSVLLLDLDTLRGRRTARALGDARCAVTVAHSVSEALVFVAIHRPDAVIVTLASGHDLVSPASVLRELMPGVRIIFTGSDDAAAIQVLEAGEDYVPRLSHAGLLALRGKR